MNFQAMRQSGALDPATASLVLMLAQFAQTQHPSDPLGWLMGYCTRAAGEPLGPRPETTNGTAIGRML